MPLCLTQDELDGLAAECRQAVERVPLFDIPARNKVIAKAMADIQEKLIARVLKRAGELDHPLEGEIFIEKI